VENVSKNIQEIQIVCACIVLCHGLDVLMSNKNTIQQDRGTNQD